MNVPFNIESHPQTNNDMYSFVNNFVMTPVVFILIVVLLVAYFVFAVSLGGGTDGDVSNSANMQILWIILIVVAFVIFIVNFAKYFYGVDISASLKNIFQNKPEVDIKVVNNTTPIPEITLKKQVFNIPGNNYSYNDAKSLCSAYGAKLATYSELEDAYQHGADWCNYGWSAEQMALYPTQKKTYNKLSTIPGHEHDCGRPGINGGYIANPHVKFGANCFGYKPKITETEDDLMKNSSPYPKNLKDIAMEERVNYWKSRLDDILVSPFNHSDWSKIYM